MILASPVTFGPLAAARLFQPTAGPEEDDLQVIVARGGTFCTAARQDG
jgi:hypothetical protein